MFSSRPSTKPEVEEFIRKYSAEIQNELEIAPKLTETPTPIPKFATYKQFELFSSRPSTGPELGSDNFKNISAEIQHEL